MDTRTYFNIDSDLFEIFLRNGVYKVYAQRFLKEEQIDIVNIEEFLAK